MESQRGRPASGPTPENAAKKPRIDPGSRQRSQMEAGPASPIEVAGPEQLVTEVALAVESGDPQRAAGLLSGGLAVLRDDSNKAVQAAVACGILLIVKLHLKTFRKNPIYVSTFAGYLPRKSTATTRHALNHALPAVICAVLIELLRESTDWPMTLFNSYLTDALGERVWVDAPESVEFIANLVTVFGPPVVPGAPPAAGAGPAVDVWEEEVITKGGGAKSPRTLDDDAMWEEEEEISEASGGGDGLLDVRPRYHRDARAAAERLLIERARNILQSTARHMKGAPGAQTKQVDNLIRTLALGVSFQQVRVIIGKELQGWISNHADGASEALVSMLQGLPTFCTTNTKDDQNFLISLLRLRMTPKAPLLAPVLSAVEGLLRAHAQYPIVALQYLVQTEVATPENSASARELMVNEIRSRALHVALQLGGERNSKIFGCMAQDCLAEQFDPRAGLRSLMMKAATSTAFRLTAFADGLLPLRQSQPKFNTMAPALRERFVLVVAEVLALAMIANCGVNDATLFEDMERWLADEASELPPSVHAAKAAIADVQKRAVKWLKSIPTFIRLRSDRMVRALHHVLLLLGPEAVLGAKETDLISADAEKYRFCTRSAFIDEETLLAVVAMGRAPESECALPADAALGALRELLRRACLFHRRNVTAVKVSSADILEHIIQLGIYRPNVNNLPPDYRPPDLAVTQQYYFAWIVLTMLAALAPITIGAVGWQSFPTLRVMMTMCITGQAQVIGFSSTLANGIVTKVSLSPDEESAVRREETAGVLEFEGFLAKAHNAPPPTEQTSKILALICGFTPREPCRVLPRGAADELLRVAKKQGLGQILCASRTADFLSDIIRDTGAAATMQWLVPLIKTVPTVMTILSTTVLCTFYLGEASVKIPKSIRTSCRSALQITLTVDSTDAADAVNYFLQRLLDEQDEGTQARNTTLLEALFVLPSCGSPTTLWLAGMHKVPCYHRVKEHVAECLERLIRTTTGASVLRSSAEQLVHSAPGLSRASRSINALCNVIEGRSLARACLFSTDPSTSLAAPMLAMLYTYVMGGGESIANGGGAFDLRLPSVSDMWTVSSSVIVAMLYLVSCVSVAQRTSKSYAFWLEVMTSTSNKQVLRRISVTLPRDLRLALLRSGVLVIATYALMESSRDLLVDAFLCHGLPNDVLEMVLTGLSSTMRKREDVPAGVLTKRKVNRLLQRLDCFKRADPAALQKNPFYRLLQDLKRSFGKVGRGQAAVTGRDCGDAGAAMDIEPGGAPQIENGVAANAHDSAPSDYGQLADAVVAGGVAAGVSMCRIVTDLRTAVLDGTVNEVAAAIVRALDRALRSTPSPCESLAAFAPQWAALAELLHVTASADLVVPLLLLIQERRADERDGERFGERVLLGVVIRLASHSNNHDIETPAAALDDALRDALSAPRTARADATVLRFALRVTEGRGHIPKCGTDDLRLILHGLSKRQMFDFELIVSKLVRSYLAGQPEATEPLVRLISEVVTGVQIGDSKSLRLASYCYDWLAALDPELAVCDGSDPLWLKCMRGGEAVGWQARCLLTTTLESCSGSMLHQRLGHLLSPDLAGHVSSTVILDIVMSTMRQARRWLGTREIGKGMSACTLTEEQVGCVAGHIVHSVAANGCADLSTTKAMIRQWVALLMHAISTDLHLHRVLSVLTTIRDDNGHGGLQSARWVAADFLMSQIYFLKPHLTDHGAALTVSVNEVVSMGSVLDPVIQRALALLTPDVTMQGSDSAATERSYVLIRKLALSHPRRVLRFVPSLASMLGGSLDLDAQGLLFKRVDVVCDHVVGLVEALRPLVFQDAAAAAMTTIVAPLIEFLRIATTGEDSRLDGVVSRTVGLLVDFVIANCSAAREPLLPHTDVLEAAAQHCAARGMSDNRMNRAAVALTLITNVHVERDSIPSRGHPSVQCANTLEQLGNSHGMPMTKLVAATETLPLLIGSNPESAAMAIELLIPWLLHKDARARRAAYVAVCGLAVQCANLGHQVQSALVLGLHQMDNIGIVRSAVEFAAIVYSATPGGGGRIIAALFKTCSVLGVDTRPAIKAILQTAQPVA